MTVDMPSYDPAHFKGRVTEVSALQDAIRQCARVAVYGLAGIGKSAIVGAAYAGLEAEIQERSFVVDCDRENTVAKIVTVLANELRELKADTDPSSKSEPSALRGAVIEALKRRAHRSLVVFDNAETIWWGADRREMRSLLDDLTGAQLVAIVVAIRTTDLPAPLADANVWKRIRVTELEVRPAVDLFQSWAPRCKDDPTLATLVDEELQRVPLAIKLFAPWVEKSGADLSELKRDLKSVLATLPLSVVERWRSLEACLRFSIDRLQENRDAVRLLALLGALPDGILDKDLDALAAALLAELRPSEGTLRDLGLADWKDSRLATLKPIRDYLERAVWPSAKDLSVAREHYLGLLSSHQETIGRDDPERFSRAALESRNVASMAATLPDRGSECDALLRQGDAELRAGQYAKALNSFRSASTIACGARDPGRLALAALGISGGLTGSGHAFDRADEERLSLLRDAHHLLAQVDAEDEAARPVLSGEARSLISDDPPTLQLRVVVRLLAELHFDASEAARQERTELANAAKKLEHKPGIDTRVQLQLALQRLKSASPLKKNGRSALAERLDAARRLVEEDVPEIPDPGAEDFRAEIEARHLNVAALLEAGRIDDADEQMQSATRRIDRLQDPDDRDRFRRHERIVRRTQCLFAAEYDPVREELKEEPQGDPTNSPYRRWLHQRVLLALDTEDPANWVDESDWVSRVSQLTAALERIERRKFGLPEQADLDAELAYKWWPTWRSTLALVLATRGEDRDRERALKLIENLASPTNTPADHENPLFGGILQHEYYVQVLALITLAIERLHALEATRGPTPGGSWDGTRRSWAGALNRRLDPFAAQAVVPGSAVMNLGSVYSFLAMLFACEENWEGYVGMFEKGCKRNKELRGRAAVVRTLVTHAEMEGLRGSSRSEGVAREAREMAAKLKMIPWARRAEALM